MSEAEFITQSEKSQIVTNERDALLCLNYAIATHNLTLHSFQFMKSVIAKYKNAYVLTHCARLMSWLPACERLLSVLFSEALVQCDLNLEQRFILFQL
jgi:hypothetical protein